MAVPVFVLLEVTAALRLVVHALLKHHHSLVAMTSKGAGFLPIPSAIFYSAGFPSSILHIQCESSMPGSHTGLIFPL